jgi:hypothetical protein
MSWSSDIPLWDHHCHALVGSQGRADMETFSRALSEAPPDYPLMDLQETVTYRRAVAVAARYLGTPADAKAVERALDATDFGAYSRTLFHAAGYGALLVDTGYRPAGGMDPDAMAETLGIPVYKILRLETVAQGHLGPGVSFADWLAAVQQALRTARGQGYVGVKSIIAYRSGLAVRRSRRVDAEAAYLRMVGRGETRLTDPDLLNYLLWEMTPVLIQERLPLQFHTGFGDPDTDLYKGNPLLLRDYLEQFMRQGHRIVLLHTYPYHREAGYLASVYPGVFLDVSLALPLAATGGRRILAEAMELAPASRVVFASDAHSRPESFYIAADLWRAGLDDVLGTAVREHHVPPAVAERWAARVLADNARDLYGLR